MKVTNLPRPAGIGVRVDDGFEEGMEVPIYYDPMLSKLITHGKDRQEAIERMVRAIKDYQITGVETTLSFGKYVMQHPAFTSGDFDTHFVKNHFDHAKLDETNELEAEAAAILATTLLGKGKASVATQASACRSKWRRIG